MQPNFQWIPYCGEAPTPELWLSRWNFDPALVVPLLVGAVALLIAAHRHTLPPRRLCALCAAWALTVLLYISPLCALSSAFFTVRVIHHMALVLLIAPLLVFGAKPWLIRLPAPPVRCTALAALVFWLWHAPAPYAAALSSNAVYGLMQLSLLGSALLFWLAVLRAKSAVALAMMLAATLQMGLLGALIMFATRALYAPHLLSAASWGVAPLEDQQLAGLLMWAPGSIVYLIGAMLIGRHALARPQAPDGRPA